LHYWLGSINNPQEIYPNYCHKFNIVTDNIKITQEYKNEIPDRSWMLYLLELFNTQNIAVELNLISQYDDQNYFEAIFNGFNRYRFIKVLPETGNNYLRQIKFDKSNLSIEYYLKNLRTETVETFVLDMNTERSFSYHFSNCFSGIEWWNKIDNRPYPIRFSIEISNLMYGYNDNPSDSESIIFFPVNSLTSNKDGNFTNVSSAYYPVRFIDDGTKNGCICYRVQQGYCINGLSSRIYD
jgi:hypothetical protein